MCPTHPDTASALQARQTAQRCTITDQASPFEQAPSPAALPCPTCRETARRDRFAAPPMLARQGLATGSSRPCARPWRGPAAPQPFPAAAQPRIDCRQAAAPALATSAARAAAAAAGQAAAPRPAVDATQPVSGHPVPAAWLAYSWRVNNLPLGQADVALERLRRQLGRGGRWAWHSNGEEVADSAEASDEEGGNEPVCSSGQSQPAATPSSRGTGRRSSSRRQCRGRVQAGAAAFDTLRPWRLHNDPLPAELQVGAYSGKVQAAAVCRRHGLLLHSALCSACPPLPNRRACRTAAPSG